MSLKTLSILILFGALLRLIFLTTLPYVDDAYISLRYAKNFANGAGFVYNPGEQVLGVTNTLWVLLESLFFPHENLAPVFLSVIFFAGSSIILYFLLSELLSDSFSLVGVLLYIFDSFSVIWHSRGLEMPLFHFLIFLTLFLFNKQKQWWLLSGTLLVLTRPEGAIFLVILAFFDKSHSKILSFFRSTISILFAFGVNFILADAPIANSVLAKLSYSVNHSLLYNFLSKLYPLFVIFYKAPLQTFLILIGAQKLLRSKLAPLFIFSLGLPLIYFIIDAPFFLWYYSLFVPIISALSVWGLVEKNFKTFVFPLLLIFFLNQASIVAKEYMGLRTSLVSLNKDKLAIVDEAKTLGISSLVIGDIGVIGYYSDAYVWDYLGLVTPEAVGCWNKNELTNCIFELNPDAILVNSIRFKDNPQLSAVLEDARFVNYSLYSSRGWQDLYVRRAFLTS